MLESTRPTRPLDVVDALVGHLGQPLIAKTHRRQQPRFLVVIAVSRQDEYCGRRSSAVLPALARALADEIAPGLGELEEVWVDEFRGRVVALLTATQARGLSRRIEEMCRRLGERPWRLPDGSTHYVDIGAGWTWVSDRVSSPARARTLLSGVTAAAYRALRRRDLVCVKVARTRRPGRFLPSGVRLALQILTTGLVSIVLPFVFMVLAYRAGVDTATFFYFVVVVALGVTAVLIWVESLHALTPPTLPDRPVEEPPRATAIVAAYLPNEADSIVETLSHLLAQDYPGELQVILAYNSPIEMAVEAELAELASTHPHLDILRVPDSSSKAQNVNAALLVARGEFIGIFDADHHPMPGAFTRAWHWIADGADVVQGHCVVRNGDDSVIARTVAVEFEQIYAVSHPGRASMHRFGLFGGSNGYWRASVLRQMRMRYDRLTEDIDVSIRTVLDGKTIVNDPGLVSRELAPVTTRALWRQRMRWAQGWFQVSLRQLPWAMRSRSISGRQRFGLLVLLAWREIYPWISPMIVAVLAFIAWRDGGLSWSSPLFLLTTLYTATSGPVQVLFAWRLAAPEIRRRRSWFLWYLLFSSIFYNEFKNLIARVAQIKELTGEHEWTVTPRGTMRAHPAVVAQLTEEVAA